jgi:proteasome lid subunit RPN8/RPN11
VTTLWLREEQARQILEHACLESPQEACGLILGQQGQVERVVAAANIASDPLRRYMIDPQFLSQHLPEAIGFYHSHPRGEPIPSPTDVREAFYPDMITLIAGLKGEPSLAAWKIANGRVDPIEMHIGPEAPPRYHDLPFTRAQKIAVAISIVAAFCLLIWLSVALLPPAPPISPP